MLGRLLLETSVHAEWVDYNGHMNDACYALVFSRALDRLIEQIGLDSDTRARSGHTIYTLENLIRYQHELKLGATLQVWLQLLEHDAKRLRVFLRLLQPEQARVAATSEQLLMNVQQLPSGPKSSVFLPQVAQALATLAQQQAGLPYPDNAGRGISLRRQP